MAGEPRDALYQVTFGSGALLRQGGLVVKSGKICGIGHHVGEYSGSASFDAGAQLLDLEIGVRVDAAVPIATGLKAGPAGSTIHFKAKGAIPEPQTTFGIDLAGNKGEMTLSLFEELRPPAAAPDISAVPPHPDAFPNGVYMLESAGIGYTTQTVVVLNSGQLLGIGEMGGQYRGEYVFDEVRKLTVFKGVAKLPPGVPLVVGGAVGTQWLTAPLASEGKFNRGRSRFSFSLAGRAIDAALMLRQPLPA